MLLRVVVFGMGVKIPNQKLGINGPSGIYIQTKVNMNALHSLYGITKFMPNPNGENGAMLMGYAYTKWISMTGGDDSWIKNIDDLTGTVLSIDISGTVLFKGSVNLNIASVDSDTFDITVLTDKKYIPASGMSFAGSTIRGKLLKFARSAESIKVASR